MTETSNSETDPTNAQPVMDLAVGVAGEVSSIILQLGAAIPAINHNPKVAAQLLIGMEPMVIKVRDSLLNLANECVDLDMARSGAVQGVSKGGLVNADGTPIR